MIPACRRLAAALTLLACSQAGAAPYPDENQLRTAIGTGASVLRSEGLSLEMHDARAAGMKLSLLAAGLNLETGICTVFYNPEPVEGLSQFFAGLAEADLPTWLDAIAVHEATHCIEQREAYLRQRFDKVLPPGIEAGTMTVQGYLSVIQSGAVETWGEALADIASVLYLKRTVPARWTEFARGIAGLRRDLAGKWPEHDTSAWLERVIAALDDHEAHPDLFEAAFQLRRRHQPE